MVSVFVQLQNFLSVYLFSLSFSGDRFAALGIPEEGDVSGQNKQVNAQIDKQTGNRNTNTRHPLSVFCENNNFC